MFPLIRQPSAYYEGIYELEMSFRRMRWHTQRARQLRSVRGVGETEKNAKARCESLKF
jgi:hypothetical protein